MLNLWWSDNNLRFEFSFRTEEYEWDVFQEVILLFKQLWMFYDPDLKVWYVQNERIDEILIMLKRENYEVIFADGVQEKIKELNSHEPELKFMRSMQIDMSILRSNIQLYEFQKNGIQWRSKRNRYIDSDDAGLGKTVQNIIIFSNLYKKDKIDGIIIIVPNGLTYHWKYEILEFVNVFSEDDIQIINNKNKIKPFLKYRNKKILIIPSHLLHHVLLSYKKGHNSKKSAKRVRWKKFIDIKLDWNKKNLALVIDESHEFKNPIAIRTKAINSIRDEFNYRFLLSATPAINRIEDFYSQINIIDQSLIPMSYNAFKLWLADDIGNKWDAYAINRYNTKNVAKLKENIKYVILKRLKEDIPEMQVKKFVKKIHLQMTPEQKQMYKLLLKHEIFQLEEEYDVITWRLVLNKLPLLCKIIDNPLLFNGREYQNAKLNTLLSKWTLDKDPKFNTLKSMLENYISYKDEKVLVYGIHPETLNMLEDRFQKYKPLTIHGSLSVKDIEKDRAEKQHIFNTSDENKIMFLSALTSSQGLNLQKKCKRIIIYEFPFDATHFRQLQDRTHRIDSVEDTIVEILYYPESLDNLRVNRGMNRVNFNDMLGKEVTQIEFTNLVNGLTIGS